MTKVELVTRTEGVGIYEGMSPGEIVEAVARHGKIKDYGRLIEYLMKHKHWSPLEHVHMGFRIETARDISAQMMRHRSFHWQELSQRYDVIQQFMPIEVREQGKTNRQVGDKVLANIVHTDQGFDFLSEFGEKEENYILLHSPEQEEAIIAMTNALYEAQHAYKLAIDSGIARECARRILPMCAKTVVHMTGNLRDFLAYINVRNEPGTQKEHREISQGIGEALAEEFPKFAEVFPQWEEGGFM